MPFQKRHVKPRENLIQLYETNKPEKVLTGVFMSNMIEMLRQLGELSSYSCEIFDDLTYACDVVGHRCGRLGQRVEHLGRSLPAVEQLLDSHPPEVFYKTPHTRVWTRWDSLSGNVIDPSRRPKALSARREAVAAAPPLSSFQIPGAPLRNCSSAYSNPNFFVEQWIEAEAEKQAQAAAERKERKKKRKKKKKKQSQQKRQKVAAVKVKTYDARGAEFGTTAEKEVEAVLAVPDTMDVPVSSLLQSLPAPDPGTTTPIYEILNYFTETAFDRHAAAQSLVVEQVAAPPQQQQPAHTAGAPAQQQQQYAQPPTSIPAAPPSGPPTSGPPGGFAPPPSTIPGPPPTAPPQQAGMPGPPSGPPPGAFSPPPGPPPGGMPPGPPAGAPPMAGPAIPAAPPIGLVTAARAPPSAAPSRIPAAPGVPMAPAIPMAASAPALPAAASSSDSIMAGIRGGLKLKKVEPPAPKKADSRNVLMTQIRKGAAGLKKLDRAALQQEKEQKLQTGGNSIYDILARRAAIAADSDEESDDSEWESD